jgi:hypothetical protein
MLLFQQKKLIERKLFTIFKENARLPVDQFCLELHFDLVFENKKVNLKIFEELFLDHFIKACMNDSL